ncbi:unnamed protein product [Pseudo-nitzschia multistriata]|uniref:Uncharacterized protein n=1 Tax=Pseudo-nitzschia multistriata TaxID=183589 RepID=A0A448ZMI0_9STRA|nr:unnamed protein product [Pseudo-nitzschia multistriata]
MRSKPVSKTACRNTKMTKSQLGSATSYSSTQTKSSHSTTNSEAETQHTTYPEFAIQKRRHEFRRRGRGIVKVQHDGRGGIRKFSKLAVLKGDRSWLVAPERIFPGPDEDESLDADVFQRVVRDPQNFRPVQVQVSSLDPANILPQTLVSAPNGHVGPEGKRRHDGLSPRRLDQVAIEIELPNLVHVARAKNVQARNGGVRHDGFPLVNRFEIVDAGLPEGPQWQEEDQKDRPEKTATAVLAQWPLGRQATHCQTDHWCTASRG